MRPFVWHPPTNPFPKTKVDRLNRKKPFLKMSDTLEQVYKCLNYILELLKVILTIVTRVKIR
jgi:hypothetical protein